MFNWLIKTFGFHKIENYKFMNESKNFDTKTTNEALKRLDALDKESAAIRELISTPNRVILSSDEIMKLIKSYEDACEHQNLKPLTIENFRHELPEDQEAAFAYHQMVIIYRAINQKRKPNYNDPNEYRYWPWMKWDKLASGFGFVGTSYGDSITNTGVGARLCCFSAEHAKYIGTQFQTIINRLFTN